MTACDRCGEVADDIHSYDVHKHVTWHSSPPAVKHNAELCPDCSNWLDAELKSLMEHATTARNKALGSTERP